MTRATLRARLKRYVCLGAAAALLATGCGSAKQHATETHLAGSTPQTVGAQTPTAATQSATTTTDRASATATTDRATTGATTKASVSRVAPSANGKSAGSGSAPGGAAGVPSRGGSSATPIAGSRRFIYLANALCQGAAGVAPSRPVPTSAAQLREYASVALPSAQRINLALRRLSAQIGHTAGVARLLLDYQSLVSLYRQAAYRNDQAVSSRSITAAQQSATTSARALHVPLCAPVAFAR